MAHNKDDNPTANRPWFGPIPTGADWNPAHGADPDVIDFHRYAAERGSQVPTPPTTLHTRTAYAPNRRHDSASSATYPPTRPRQSRLMLSAISPCSAAAVG